MSAQPLTVLGLLQSSRPVLQPVGLNQSSLSLQGRDVCTTCKKPIVDKVHHLACCQLTVHDQKECKHDFKACLTKSDGPGVVTLADSKFREGAGVDSCAQSVFSPSCQTEVVDDNFFYKAEKIKQKILKLCENENNDPEEILHHLDELLEEAFKDRIDNIDSARLCILKEILEKFASKS